MQPSDIAYKTYVAILKEELVPATGCTEPICIAYGAARARALLGALPVRVVLTVSGNILKNVKSVVVPGTGGLKGIRAAAAAGVVAGDAEAQLQVVSKLTEADHARILAYMGEAQIEINCAQTPLVFDVLIEEYDAEGHVARLRIVNSHTNIVLLQKDDTVLLEKPIVDSSESGLADKSLLNVRDIVDFAETVRIEDVKPMLERWLDCNSAIAQEGLRGDWGANIGSVLLARAADARTRARAMAAAGSDARMSGCEMPVVILSGSGNQGITASMPVLSYANSLGVERDKLYRALCISALITVQQKAGIGRLSAYCGATSAGVGAGAGVCYLHGGSYEEIAQTVINGVAMLSGMVCDGAKPSCAAKISAAVDAGLLGYEMCKYGKPFHGGDGFLGEDVDATIDNVGRMARAMRETDKEILDIMREN